MTSGRDTAVAQLGQELSQSLLGRLPARWWRRAVILLKSFDVAVGGQYKIRKADAKCGQSWIKVIKYFQNASILSLV